jgi:predicted nucleotidyltransferase
MSIKQQNIDLLAHVADKLGSLREEVVFLGGTATALLLTDPSVPDVRQTIDVDCVTDVITLGEYNKFSDKLRNIGFKQDITEPVICRWFIETVSVDVMPTEKSVLGFGNMWAKEAVKNADKVLINDSLSINLVSPTYFIATKLDAFNSRGNNDYLCSHDLEDIITVIDGRPEIIEEIHTSDFDVRTYIQDQFNNIMSDKRFIEALPGHLNYGGVLPDRLKLLTEKLNEIVSVR